MKLQRYFGPVLVLALLGISGAVFVSTPFTAIAQDDIQSVAAGSVVRQIGTTEPDFGNTTMDVAEIPEKSAGAQDWQGDYFFFDAEEGTIGEEIPHHQSGGGSNFCQPECSGLGDRATYQSSGSVPQGNQYFQWETVDSQGNHYCEIKNVGVFPVTEILGKTLYLAFYMRFDRKDGNDVWHEGSGTQSWDKGIEMRGHGVRWTVGWGQWDKCNGSYSPGFAANQDHHFTIGSGNPTYHLPGSEYNPNLNGYSCQNPPQLTYERWYAMILGVNMACDTTGSRTLWLNGVKIAESTGIQTTNDCSPDIDHITMGGTLAQGPPPNGYDAPSHYRKFDALILTDSWQDIIDGGYLSDPEADGELLLHGTPDNQAIHLSWPVSATLPVTSTWQLSYDGPSGDQLSPITGILSPTRAYTLTGLTNYTFYTVTLNAMLDSTPFLTDTVTVMPTGIFVYLPLVLKGN